MKCHVSFGWFLAALILLAAAPTLPAANQSKKVPVISKWGRFEQAFKSSTGYSNALQEATITVVFISPLGETNQVYGFWDGGRTWRVRFSPNQPGRWTFRTICSDTVNKGLHNQKGEFLCTAATGQTRFNQHGPIRVARDQRHLEHEDGTPFFWLADTVWNGARQSRPRDWEFYAQLRTIQKFTVAQWAVGPGKDARGHPAFITSGDRVAVNPSFFQRLDASIETLSRAGILSAIVPFAERGPEKETTRALPEDQLALVVRYVVARWGADPVVWLLAVDGEDPAKTASRWKRIGQAVFANVPHAPVMVYPGKAAEVLDQFRDENWVDVFGLQTVPDLNETNLKAAFSGRLAAGIPPAPSRPLISFAPHENGVDPQSNRRFSSDDVRHCVYWSLLLAPPAGISYGGQGLTTWSNSIDPNANAPDLPLWKRALFMPAAKQMTWLAELMDSIEFWRLQPAPKAIRIQPGDLSPDRYIAAALSKSGDLMLVYVPEERALEVALEALPPAPVITWFNPRTGQKSPAVAVVTGHNCQFPTPDRGDWVLVVRAGK